MTPRPQDPQSNSPLRLPRLAPVAAPVSVGRPVSQSQLQTANQFAGLSQSLAKSLVNIKRINEKDDDIAGAAAFHSGEDVDETTKSKKFLSGMHHASAVSQANEDIIGLKAHLDDYAAGDGQYTFDPETGDVVGLTDYGQMALDFIAPLRPENRKGDVYAATWGPRMDDAISEVTEKHMNLQKTRQVEAYKNLEITNTSAALMDSFENHGAAITPENLEEIVAFQTSLRESFGEEVTGLGSTKDNLLNALSVTVTNVLTDEDSDLDAAEVWVDALLFHKGLAGPGVSFMDSAKTVEQASGILDSLDGVADARHQKKTREIAARHNEALADSITLFGGLEGADLMEVGRAVVAGEGEWATLPDEDRRSYMMGINNLQASLVSRMTLDNALVAKTTQDLVDRISLNEFKNPEEGMAVILANKEDLDISKAVKALTDHFEKFSDETEETMEQQRRKTGNANLTSGVMAILNQAPQNQRAEFQSQALVLKASLEAEQRKAIEEGRREDLPAILVSHQGQMKELETKVAGSAEVVRGRKTEVNAAINTGDFSGASRQIGALVIDGVITAEEARNLDIRLNSMQERDAQDHNSQSPGGVTGNFVARLDATLPGMGGDNKKFEKNESDVGVPSDQYNFKMDNLVQTVEEIVDRFRTTERHKFNSSAEYQAALTERLENVYIEIVKYAGTDEEYLAAQLQKDKGATGTLIPEFFENDMRGVGGSKGAPKPVPTATGGTITNPDAPSAHIREPLPALDPLSGNAIQPNVLPSFDRWSTDVYRSVANAPKEEQGKRAVELLAETIGFSVEQITSGKVTLEMTQEHKAFLADSEKRALNYDGIPGNHPLENEFKSKYPTSFGHFITLGFFSSKRERAELNENIKGHYAGLRNRPPMEVDIDLNDIRALLEDTLVFRTQEELDNFKNTSDHPYLDLFELSPSRVAGFTENQQALLDGTMKVSPETMKRQIGIEKGRVDAAAAQVPLAERLGDTFLNTSSPMAELADARKEKVSEMKDVRELTAVRGDASDDFEAASGGSDEAKEIRRAQEASDAQGSLDVKAADDALGRFDDAQEAQKVQNDKDTSESIETLWDSFEAQETLDALSEAKTPSERKEAQRRHKQDTKITQAKALKARDTRTAQFQEKVARTQAFFSGSAGITRKPTGMDKLTGELASLPAFADDAPLRTFFSITNRNGDAWPEGTKNDPGKVWDLILADKKRMGTYVKYLKVLEARPDATPKEAAASLYAIEFFEDSKRKRHHWTLMVKDAGIEEVLAHIESNEGTNAKYLKYMETKNK